jgi:hypothetical protein
MMEAPIEELFFLLSHIATEDEQRVVGQWFDSISSAPKPPEGKRKHILLVALTLAWFALRPPTEAESGIPAENNRRWSVGCDPSRSADAARPLGGGAQGCRADSLP